MSRISEVWITAKLQQLKIITANYSSQKKEQVRLTCLINLVSRLTEFDSENEDILIGQIESLINTLPKELEEFMNDSYQPLFYELEFYLNKRFDLIPKNSRKKRFNPF